MPSTNITATDIVNATEGFSGIADHACTSTDGLIAWVVVGSIWLVLLFLILSTPEKHWAVGVASFVGLIFAIGFLIICGAGSYLVLVMTILAVLGLVGGFVLSLG